MVSAVRQAQEIAGERDVGVSAGSVGGQALAAGIVDEIRVSLVPVLFGTGVRFFGSFTESHLMLNDPEVIQGKRVTHLVFPVRETDNHRPTA